LVIWWPASHHHALEPISCSRYSPWDVVCTGCERASPNMTADPSQFLSSMDESSFIFRADSSFQLTQPQMWFVQILKGLCPIPFPIPRAAIGDGGTDCCLLLLQGPLRRFCYLMAKPRLGADCLFQALALRCGLRRSWKGFPNMTADPFQFYHRWTSHRLASELILLYSWRSLRCGLCKFWKGFAQYHPCAPQGTFSQKCWQRGISRRYSAILAKPKIPWYCFVLVRHCTAQSCYIHHATP